MEIKIFVPVLPSIAFPKLDYVEMHNGGKGFHFDKDAK